MTRTFVDFHIIQTVPPSNLNRDDTGSPKTARFGGVRRARVSSQAWKRATRQLFPEYLDTSELGTRTKRVIELTVEKMKELSPDVETDAATKAAEAVFKAAGIVVKEPRKNAEAFSETGYLLFLSATQIAALAREAVKVAAGDLESPDKKTVQALAKTGNSVDLALFGRMVADVSDLNVDASCQVAHALSTHAVETEYDYFTAVDDHKAADSEEDAGAGMIGTVEFNSATLYRYATIDIDLLSKNLGDLTATLRAVSAFAQAFAKSMPSGKVNTFANHTLPDAMLITVRSDQPVSYVGAFEDPVPPASTGGFAERSAQKLADHAAEVNSTFGDGTVESWAVGVGRAADELAKLGTKSTFDDAVRQLSVAVEQRLS